MILRVLPTNNNNGPFVIQYKKVREFGPIVKKSPHYPCIWGHKPIQYRTDGGVRKGRM